MSNTRRRMSLFFYNWDEDNKMNCSPLIRLNIEKETYTFLIDTGASKSVFDKNRISAILDIKDFETISTMGEL